MFTSLCIYPLRPPGWAPDGGFLARLMAHFGATKVTLWGYERPLYWDDAEDHRATIELVNLTVADAIRQWQTLKLPAVNLFLHCPRWSEKIRRELQDSPLVATYEHFAPYCVSLTVGPASVGNPGQERTAARFCFAVSLGGDGMPKDLDQYRSVALASESIAALMSFLSLATVMKWDVVFNCSY